MKKEKEKEKERANNFPLGWIHNYLMEASTEYAVAQLNRARIGS